MKIDISQTKTILVHLNAILLHKCGPNIKLDLGKYKNMVKKHTEVALYYEEGIDAGEIDQYLLLCLNYINPTNQDNRTTRCIASITCKIMEDGSIEISSKTESKFEGRKFNLWLRCAAVLLSPRIRFMIDDKYTNVDRIVSRAINPISMLLMSKYFSATNTKLVEFMELNDLDYPTLTLQNMQEFYDEQNVILGDTESEQEEYMMNNEDFGEPILLTIDLTDELIMERTRQLVETVDIRCPELTPPKMSIFDNLTIRRRRKLGQSVKKSKSNKTVSSKVHKRTTRSNKPYIRLSVRNK
jgi:hypothetical protein